MSLFGLSVIIGFLKTQLYQRLASSKQEVFILDEKRKGVSFFTLFKPKSFLISFIISSINNSFLCKPWV